MKKYTLTAIAAFGLSALSAQASIVLPDAGNSVTFEAEAYDAQSGIVTGTSGDASGGSFVDGWGAGDFISFDISNLDTALTYEITFDYRKGNSGDAEFEFFGVTDGPTYTSLTSIVAPQTNSTWGGALFVASDTSTGFNIAAGTTAIQVESLGGDSHLDSFTISAVPEPSTYALLAGLTGLVHVMVRRRR